MELISANYSDIQKYYESSYVKLREYGDKLFLINKVSSTAVYFSDAVGQEGVIHLHDNHPYTLSMVLPNKAMYQQGDKCYLLQRIPARQYHRGVTSANCMIKCLTVDGWSPVPVTFTTLTGYINKPIYRPLADIIETRTTGSEAVNSRFAYQATGKRIWCDTRNIATVNPKLRVIACNRILIPELERFLLRDNVNSNYKLVGLP